jgi:uncharacterized protein YqeY
MREKFTEMLKVAMKSGDRRRVDTLRLVIAELKKVDIDARGSGKTTGDEDILAMLQKMVKSRQESLSIYEKAGREDLASQERGEIEIINEFLPKAMGEEEIKLAIKAAIADLGASSMKDMGKVVASLKQKYAGQIDFSKASALVKAALGG